MTAGKVLDITAITDIAEHRTVYAAAVLAVGVIRGGSIAIPTAALLEAWADVSDDGRPFLDLLPGVPSAVVVDLDPEQAAAAGVLAAGRPGTHRPGTAHAVHVARERGWPVVTADPDAVLALDPHVGLESLP